MKKSPAAASVGSIKSEPKTVRFWAVDFYKDAVAVLTGGRRGSKAAPMSERSAVLKMPVFWLGMLVCCQLGVQVYMGYQKSIADNQLYDAAGSDTELQKLMAESEPTGSRSQAAGPEAAAGKIVKSVGELRRMGRHSTSDQVQEAASALQEAAPDAAAKPGAPRRSVYEELAEATCQMCMQAGLHDYKECDKFEGVPSCEAAREQGLLRDWAEGIKSHRLGLELGPLVRAERVPPTPDAQRKALANIERDHLEWDAELAAEAADAKAELCSDPARKAYATCSGVAAATATTLAEEVQLARCEMCLEPHRREYAEYAECAEFRGFKTSCALSIAAGRRGVFEELCSDPVRKGYAACAVLAPTVEERAAAYLKELRSDPTRNGYAACSGLAPTVDEQAAAYLEELCSDPARKGYAACAGLSLSVEERAAAYLKEAGPTLLQQIGTAKWEMCLEPRRRGYEECAEFRTFGSALSALGTE